MRVIELHTPAVADGEARFSWSVTPSTPLYERTEFALRFPPEVDLDRVPDGLWWRIALLCLHAHWPLLRPCRVVLPVRLEEGEAETWLRLTDAAVATLEARQGGTDTMRSIEFVGSGPVLRRARGGAGGAYEGGTVSCFSGGRDGMTQAAMLSELGHAPVLVTVTSPVPWSNEHDTPRRRQVLEEITRRRDLELVEVHSDMRSGWQNHFSGERYGVSVNELTDALLYLAAASVVAKARGAHWVMMASELEVQENARRNGMVIQMAHFMYSAVTHRAVSALLEPFAIRIGSLTNSIAQFQVQRILTERYADLRDLQYSCWELSLHQAACSRCDECRKIALNLVAAGVSPAAAGIDLVELLMASDDWRPGSRYVGQPLGSDASPGQVAGRGLEMQMLRCLAATDVEEIAGLIDGDHPERERRRALEIYVRLRERALAYDVEPEPGYRLGYLDLLDEPFREGLKRILDDHLTPDPPASYAEKLKRTRVLSDWITASLRSAATPPPARKGRPPRPGGPRVTLGAEELDAVRPLLPDPEPVLGRAPDGRTLRVAETLLDGRELEYLAECMEANWISSAGPFVARFERAFAAAVDCRFAVACTSGTAALHLAAAAAGIGPGEEVLLPAFTMIATANAVRYVGATPVLVDTDALTWNLDPRRLADKLTRRTRAVIAVHTYGQPADMDEIGHFALRNGLIVIEDAAEAHGARHGDRPVGSIGDVGAFSLYGNKILTTGEGGVVTTNDERIAASARELRDHAFSPDRHFWHHRLGFNYRMTNLQAAVGLAQTERLDELVGRRMEVARHYRRQLAGIDGLELLPQRAGGVMWMFGIVIGERFGISRDELRRRLAVAGIETRTFFVPLHLQPAYRAVFAGERYPVAEELGRSGLYLPSSPRLSEQDIAYVAETIRACAGHEAAPVSNPV